MFSTRLRLKDEIFHWRACRSLKQLDYLCSLHDDLHSLGLSSCCLSVHHDQIAVIACLREVVLPCIKVDHSCRISCSIVNVRNDLFPWGPLYVLENDKSGTVHQAVIHDGVKGVGPSIFLARLETEVAQMHRQTAKHLDVLRSRPSANGSRCGGAPVRLDFSGSLFRNQRAWSRLGHQHPTCDIDQTWARLTLGDGLYPLQPEI